MTHNEDLIDEIYDKHEEDINYTGGKGMFSYAAKQAMQEYHERMVEIATEQDVSLTKLHFEKGTTDAEFQGSGVAHFAAIFAEQFKASGATNYVEMRLECPDIGPLTVIMQRANGLTPAQKVQAMETEIAELRKALAESQRNTDALLNLSGWVYKGGKWVRA